MENSIMSNDKRIRYLVLNDGTIIENYPGMKIIPYHENGQMAPIVWLRVLKEDGEVIHRINSAHVQQITY